jgi:hypothetical protein
LLFGVIGIKNIYMTLDAKPKYFLLLAFILATTVTIFLLHIRRDGLVDDAFITYRYAARFATGDGLTYNDGEKILGTSTPGYALLLALPANLIGTKHIPAISLTFSFIATIILMLSVGAIAYRISASSIVASLAALSVMTSHYTTWVMTTGMEAPVFLALFSCGLWALVYKRWTIGALLFSLLPLIRLEGVFPVGLLGISLFVNYIYHHKQLGYQWLIRNVIILILPGLIYLIAATLYYGTPLPQSVAAKSAGLYPITIAETTALISTRLSQFISPLIQPIVDTTTQRHIAFLAVLSLAMILNGGLWMAQRSKILWIVPTTLILLLAFYARSATLLFGWYFSHFDVLAVLCFAAGLYAITSFIAKRIWRDAPQWLPVLISVCLFFYMQHGVILENAVLPITPTRQPPLDEREYDYYQLTQWLGSQVPEGTTVVMPEVGVLGYYMPHITVIDGAGLVSPQAVDYFPLPENERLDAAIGAIPRSLVRDYLPDMVITLDFFVVNGLLTDDWFQENYTLVYQQNELTIEHGELLIYARNDFAQGLALNLP